MSKRILIFFPDNPYPPRYGSHKRCLMMMKGFYDLGYEVSFASSTLRSYGESFRFEFPVIDKYYIYNATKLDMKLLSIQRSLGRWLNISTQISTVSHLPISMNIWFDRVISRCCPDIIMMNYVYFDGILRHNKYDKIRRIIDTHDLITCSDKLHKLLETYLIDNEKMKYSQLESSFYDIHKLDIFNSRDCEYEFSIYEKYDDTIVISKREFDLANRFTNKTSVSFIPMVHDPSFINNCYSGFPILPIGPNLCNIHGYIYFVNKVLPLIKRKSSSFVLKVTGSTAFGVSLPPADGVCFAGFLPSLRDVYEPSGFMVCPVTLGTGQQVKIIESMSHGVPVVALAAADRGEMIHHGINGLVADNDEEFSEHIIRLWKDRNLCRKLGENAREFVAAEFSSAKLVEWLAALL